MKISRFLTASCLMFGMLPAAMAQEAGGGDWSEFNSRYAQEAALPVFTRLAAATVAMEQAAGTFCAAPDDAAQGAGLGDAYRTLSGVWASAQPFRAGPMAEAQRQERFAYWPERRNIVEKQLGQMLSQPPRDGQAITPDYLARNSVAIQGLTALERLIFPADKALPAFVDADAEQAARRCAMLLAIAGNMKGIAAEAAQGWRDAVADLADGGAFGAAQDATETAAQLYTGLLTLTEIMATQKLGAPLGADIDKAKPRQAEQWRSGQSITVLLENVRGLDQALLGPGGFIHRLPDAVRDDLAGRVKKALGDLETALAGISVPLDQAVTDGAARPKVGSALVALNRLRDLMRQELAPALGITLGFNELDGDGA